MSRRIDEYKRKHRKEWNQFNQDAKLMRRAQSGRLIPRKETVVVEMPNDDMAKGLFGLMAGIFARKMSKGRR